MTTWNISPDRCTRRVVALVDPAVDSDTDAHGNADDGTRHQQENQNLDQNSLSRWQLTQPLASLRLGHTLLLLALPELELARLCVLGISFLLGDCGGKVHGAGLDILEIDLRRFLQVQ